MDGPVTQAWASFLCSNEGGRVWPGHVLSREELQAQKMGMKRQEGETHSPEITLKT